MTTTELLDTLHNDDRVRVGQSWLTVPRRPVAAAIADVLRSVLPEQEVFFAIETSKFDEQLSGQLVWWLVIPGALVEVKTTAEVDGQISHAQVGVRVVPLRWGNVGIIVVDHRRQGHGPERGPGVATVTVDGEPFKVQGDEAVPFVKAILSASNREGSKS